MPLIPKLEKIIEKLIKVWLVSYLGQINLLDLDEFGFQHKKNVWDTVFSCL